MNKHEWSEPCSDGAICPYCKHIHDNLTRNEVDDGEIRTKECEQCHRIFEISSDVYIYYMTRKLSPREADHDN